MNVDEPAVAFKIGNSVKRNTIVGSLIAKVEIPVPLSDFCAGFAEDGTECRFLYRFGKEAV